MVFKKTFLFTVLFFVWLFAWYITYSYHELNIKQLHHTLIQLVTEPTFKHLGTCISLTIYHYSTYLIGTIFILIGVYAYFQKSNSIVIINFFYLMCITGLAIIFAKPSSLDLSIAKEIEILLVSIGPYLLVSFFEYFPSSGKPLILRKIKLIILSIGIGINIIFYSFSFFSGNDNKVIEIISLALFINIVLAIFISLFLIKKQWDNSKWFKSQLITLFVGLVFSFSPILFLTIIPGTFKFPSFSFSYTIISIIILPVTLAYLLTKQEVFDFSKYLKTTMLKLFPLFITFSFLNFSFKSIFQWDNEQIVRLNLLIIIGFALYSYVEKILAPFKIRNWKTKLQEIQSEKKFITQKFHDGSYLVACANFITNVINKVISVDGICIIWNYNSPYVVCCSGKFEKANKKEYLIQQFLNLNRESKKIIKVDKYHYIPLNSNTEILGAIILGQKANLTLFDKDDLLMLEKIQLDALDLFLSAQSLYNLHMDFKQSQQALLTVDLFNALLLNELEAEKKRLSIFLHDEVLQNLLFISNKIQALSKEDIPNLYELEKSLINTINEIRELCSELHPIIVEDLGLDVSLKILKRKIENNHDITVNVYYNIPFKIIPKSLSVDIFRIIKELTHNSIKHSSASTIDLSITETGNILTVSVKDNGRGFILPDKDTLLNRNNMGLMTVQKKVNQLNGTFHIQSQLNLGTSIIITFPSEWGESIEYTSINSR